MTFFLMGCLSASNVVNVLIPYVFLAILLVIDLGLKPNKQAPLITETCGLLGTKIYIVLFSNLLMISDFKKGDSLKPPTMKIKLTLSFF